MSSDFGYIRATHFGHGIGNSERHETDSKPAPYHYRWTAGLDADDENSRQRGPGSDDAEREADHAQQPEAAFELYVALTLVL